MGLFTFSAKDKHGFRMTRFRHISGFNEFIGSGIGDVIDCTINTDLGILRMKAVTGKKAEIELPFHLISKAYTSADRKGLNAKKYLYLSIKKQLTNTTLFVDEIIKLEIVQASYKWDKFMSELNIITEDARKKEEIRKIHTRKPRAYALSTLMGQYNAYNYNISFTPSPNADDIFVKMQENDEWRLDINVSDNIANLLYEDKVFGSFTDRIDMIVDFLNRNDYVKAQLKSYEEDKKTILLQFFIDPETKYADCESDEVELTNCLNSECQDNLQYMYGGELLELEEVSRTKVTVNENGNIIGTLPIKYAKRYLDCGAKVAVFVENSENDNGKYIPLIKIYW